MERLYIVKMSILPKLFYRMNVVQINIPEELIYESNENFFLQLFWKNKLGERAKAAKDKQCKILKPSIKPE